MHALRSKALRLVGARSGEASSRVIDLTRTMEHVRYLSEELGPRFAGTDAERRAADYVARQLVVTSRPVEFQFFTLPNGEKSRNVSIFLPGDSRAEFVIGAHIDSAQGSPGANDNASGVAVLLELARVFGEQGSPADLRLVFFGGEELIEKGQIHHHYGSRNFVHSLTGEEIKNITGMISLDMAGFGEHLKVHSSGIQPSLIRDGLLTAGSGLGIKMSLLSSQAASDHESFEQAGVAASWIGYHRDSENHTPRDTIDRINSDNLARVADVVHSFVMGCK